MALPGRRVLSHRWFAGAWPVAARLLESAGVTSHRRRLLAPLTGRVLEVGAGDGRNFPHYPAGVTEVVAIEPNPHLRRRARTAAEHASVPVTVHAGTAEEPSVAAGFDAAVCCLVLCSVTDPVAALRGIAGVLNPGGRLRFLEHVVADDPRHRRVQRALDATVWPALTGGCHTARDTLTALNDAGFHVIEVDRFRFPAGRVPTPTSPHVLGEAVLRAAGSGSSAAAG